jgi:hypothetical protein
MEASFEHLAVLKDTLLQFQEATGLKVNFHESCLVLINIDTFYSTSLAEFFGCTMEKMSFTYLGTTHPTVLELAVRSNLVNVVG